MSLASATESAGVLAVTWMSIVEAVVEALAVVSCMRASTE
jgi:hypothetical protein